MTTISVFDGARPTRQGDLTLETAGIVPIPEDGRYGANWRNFTVWFAPNMELSGVFTGTLAATLGLGLATGIAAIVVGVLLGAAPVAALSLWGPKTGMAQLPLARLPFGKSISVPALVQWVSAVAWDALVGLFGGQAAQILFHVPFAVGVLVVLALEGLVGFLGYEFIHRLETWGAAVLTVLFVLLTYKILEHRDFPVHNTVHGGVAVAMFFLMMTIAFSGGFSWATYAADYSRYMAKDTPRRPLFWFTFAGLAGSFLWVYTIGLLGAKTLANQTAAGVQHLMGGGLLGGLALVAIMFGAVTSNALNDYSGSLAAQAGGVRIKRHVSAIIGTVGGVLPDPVARHRRRLGQVPERPAVHGVLDRALPGRGGHRLAGPSERGQPRDPGPHAGVAEPAVGLARPPLPGGGLRRSWCRSWTPVSWWARWPSNWTGPTCPSWSASWWPGPSTTRCAAGRPSGPAGRRSRPAGRPSGSGRRAGPRAGRRHRAGAGRLLTVPARSRASQRRRRHSACGPRPRPPSP